MSSTNLRSIFRVRGRLVMNPTDVVATAFPYGGTELGLVRDAELSLNVKTKEVTAEEWGGTPVEVVYGGERAVFAAVLRDYDKDAVQQIFPDTAFATPAVSPNAQSLFRYRPASTTSELSRPGRLLSTKSFKLLFAPDAADSHPFMVMYKAIPHVEAAVKLQFSLGEEFGIAVAFVGVPDLSKDGKVYEFGPRRALVL